jgi:hypothetical protein
LGYWKYFETGLKGLPSNSEMIKVPSTKEKPNTPSIILNPAMYFYR